MAVVASPGTKRASTIRPSRTTTKPCGSSIPRMPPVLPRSTSIAVSPGIKKANTTRPSPTSTRPYGSLPRLPKFMLVSHGLRQLAPTRNTVMERRPSRTRTRLINWTVVSIGNASAHSRRRMQKMVSSTRPRNGKPRPSNWRRPTSRQRIRKGPRRSPAWNSTIRESPTATS